MYDKKEDYNLHSLDLPISFRADACSLRHSFASVIFHPDSFYAVSHVGWRLRDSEVDLSFSNFGDVLTFSTTLKSIKDAKKAGLTNAGCASIKLIKLKFHQTAQSDSTEFCSPQTLILFTHKLSLLQVKKKQKKNLTCLHINRSKGDCLFNIGIFFFFCITSVNLPM